jgi:hypothetical protein
MKNNKEKITVDYSDLKRDFNELDNLVEEIKYGQIDLHLYERAELIRAQMACYLASFEADTQSIRQKLQKLQAVVDASSEI